MANSKSHKDLETEMLADFEAVRKEYGLFFTPEPIVKLMVSLSGYKKGRVLEPACGLGQFLAHVAQLYYRQNKNGRDLSKDLVGVELAKELSSQVPNYIKRYLSLVGISEKKIKIPVLNQDYLLSEFEDQFDLVIGNPPYGILGQHSHYPIPVTQHLKELYKSLFRSWYGKYNIYGLFVEKSVNLLRNGGKLVYIIPATWMILEEFKKLRAFLAENGRVEVYYLGPKMFKDASVCTVILILKKGQTGLALHDYTNGRKDLIVSKKEYSGELIRFEDDFTDTLDRSPYKLNDLFDIRISARSPEVRRNPHVIHANSKKPKSQDVLPLLSGRNLQPFDIDYQTNHLGYWIKSGEVKSLKEYYSKDRIAVGHTKGGKIVAAVDKKKYPWISDVYHLIPKDDLLTRHFPISLSEIATILNSELMNSYVSTLYREITPHTTATQLRALPLYPLKEWKKLEKRYGKRKPG